MSLHYLVKYLYVQKNRLACGVSETNYRVRLKRSNTVLKQKMSGEMSTI